MLSADPLISVVIATRNRHDSVIDTVDSILKSSAKKDSQFEIIVVDQSTDDACQRLMTKYRDEPRVVYQRTRTVGLARARNIAIARAKSNLIAITDDDCIVSESWLSEIQKTFAAHPKVVILFGNVLTGEHDTAAGFIPGYCRESAKIVSRVLEKNDVDGLGACMAIRKGVWREFHGFDEMLGVGGALKSSSEGDLVLQALYKGYQVCETPRVSVIHRGFRTWDAGAGLIFRYWYGTGAMYGKHLKLHPVSTCLILISLAWRWAFGASRVASSIGPNTRKIFRLHAFSAGLLKGLWLRVERETGHFRTVSAADAANASVERVVKSYASGHTDGY